MRQHADVWSLWIPPMPHCSGTAAYRNGCPPTGRHPSLPCAIFSVESPVPYFGTTLTVDFIDGEGRYEGGNISLGCRTRFKAINRYSRSLPLIDTPADSPALGNSLDTSISSGIISGIMFEISGYVCKKEDNIVVFTGGDAIYFAKRIKNSIFVICNLVLIGLALIADGYVNEKN